MERRKKKRKIERKKTGIYTNGSLMKRERARHWNTNQNLRLKNEYRLAQSSQFHNFCCFKKDVKNKSRSYHSKVSLKQTNKTKQQQK